MEDDAARYSVLPDGRVLDSNPLDEGKGVFEFDMAKREWVSSDVTVGAWRDSKPLTAEEAAALIGVATLPP